MLGRSINRTVAAGLLAVPGALFFTSEATASPATAFEDTINCATVYDETQPRHNEIDPILATQIGTLAAQGVTIHVQIWDGAGAHDINTDLSLEEAVEDRVSSCAWKDM